MKFYAKNNIHCQLTIDPGQDEDLYITSEKSKIVFEGKYKEALIELIRSELYKKEIKDIIDE